MNTPRAVELREVGEKIAAMDAALAILNAAPEWNPREGSLEEELGIPDDHPYRVASRACSAASYAASQACIAYVRAELARREGAVAGWRYRDAAGEWRSVIDDDHLEKLRKFIANGSQIDLQPLYATTAPKAPEGWVSVAERLPEKCGTYIVYDPDGGVRTESSHSSWWNHCDLERGPEFNGEPVTHWMPLPTPPAAAPPSAGKETK